MDGGGGSGVTAGGSGGEGRLSEGGKQAPLQQEALEPCDSSIVVANNSTFMVNDKIRHVTE